MKTSNSNNNYNNKNNHNKKIKQQQWNSNKLFQAAKCVLTKANINWNYNNKNKNSNNSIQCNTLHTKYTKNVRVSCLLVLCIKSHAVASPSNVASVLSCCFERKSMLTQMRICEDMPKEIVLLTVSNSFWAYRPHQIGLPTATATTITNNPNNNKNKEKNNKNLTQLNYLRTDAAHLSFRSRCLCSELKERSKKRRSVMKKKNISTNTQCQIVFETNSLNFPQCDYGELTSFPLPQRSTHNSRCHMCVCVWYLCCNYGCRLPGVSATDIHKQTYTHLCPNVFCTPSRPNLATFGHVICGCNCICGQFQY